MPIDKTPWNDDTVMPWGAHKGTKLEDIPAGYFLWLSEQKWLVDWPGLASYIKGNIPVLIQEQKEEDEAKGHVDDDDRDSSTYDDYERGYRGF